MENRHWHAALYCRISRDDGDRPERDSIVNQRRMLEDFCAREPGLDIAGVYEDSGFTGTNFDRPAFRRMLDDMDKGLVDCVIVKDLSRFGRDYIDIGYYLERFFPERGTRFIAVNDGIDSGRGAYDLMLPLKNVLNAQYARDTSDKVRKSLRAKQRRGEFVGAFAPYGYQKDPADKNRLLADPGAAETVRRIFERKAAGETDRSIAQTLNEAGVPSPIEYKRGKGCRLRVNQKYRGACPWSDSAVRRILMNETYLGHMLSNRYPSDGMHGKHRLAPRSEWIIVEGTHEPIISRELWEATRREAREASPRQTSLFGGLLRCGDCGRALARSGGGSRCYVCSAYKAYGGNACGRHAIAEDVLAETVLSDLKQLLSQAKGGAAGTRPPRGSGTPQSDGRRANAAVRKIRRQKQSLYEEYRAGRMTREAYLRARTGYDRQERALSAAAAARGASGTADMGAEARAWEKRLAGTGTPEALDRLTVENTVKEILVYDDRRVVISYSFSGEQGFGEAIRPPEGGGLFRKEREGTGMERQAEAPCERDGAAAIPAEKGAYRVERIFLGGRTAEQVVADLIRAHTPEGGQTWTP